MKTKEDRNHKEQLKTINKNQRKSEGPIRTISLWELRCTGATNDILLHYYCTYLSIIKI